MIVTMKEHEYRRYLKQYFICFYSGDHALASDIANALHQHCLNCDMPVTSKTKLWLDRYTYHMNALSVIS